MDMTRGVDIRSEGLGVRKRLTPALNLVSTFQIPGELQAGVEGAGDLIRQLEPSHRFGGKNHFHFIHISTSRPCPFHSPEEKAFTSSWSCPG